VTGICVSDLNNLAMLQTSLNIFLQMTEKIYQGDAKVD
jgi:hypothetical protein